MSEDSVFMISSEKDKIDYHMSNYASTESVINLLEDIGFIKVSAKILS